MDFEYKKQCRSCEVDISNIGSSSLYCSLECRRVWMNAYNSNYQRRRRDEVNQRLERLAILEQAIERGELVSAQTT